MIGELKTVFASLYKKSVLGSVFWFSLLGFLKPAVSIFLLPLYFLKLTPEDYGVLTMVGSITAIIGIVSNIRLDTAVRTFYFDHNDNEQQLWAYLSKMYTTVLILGILVFLLFQMVGTHLYTLLFDSEEILFKPYGEIALATALIGSCNTIYFIYLKNKVMLRKFFLYSVSAIVMTIALQAYFILYLDMRIMGVLLGNFIPIAVLFLVILLNNSKLLTTTIKWSAIKPSIVFGLPLVPFSFLLALENQMDKFFIEQYLSLEQVGIYGILIAIVGLSAVLLGALDNGIRPFMYQSLKDNDEQTKVNFTMFRSIYLLVGLIALSGIIMVGSNIHLLTDNPKYLQVRDYFTWACIAVVPLFFMRFLNLILIYYKKSKELTKSTMIKTGVMFVLMLVLIPRFGIYGAIASISISQLLNFYLFDRIVSRQTDAPSVSYGSAVKRVALFLSIVIVAFVLISPYSLGLYGFIQFLVVATILLFLDGNLIFKMAKSKL